MTRTPLNRLPDIAASMRDLGHAPGEWEAGGMAGYPRSTCGTCERAAISGPSFAYGSALDEACSTATEGPQDG